jgi:hypothetical protein
MGLWDCAGEMPALSGSEREEKAGKGYVIFDVLDMK